MKKERVARAIEKPRFFFPFFSFIFLFSLCTPSLEERKRKKRAHLSHNFSMSENANTPGEAPPQQQQPPHGQFGSRGVAAAAKKQLEEQEEREEQLAGAAAAAGGRGAPNAAPAAGPNAAALAAQPARGTDAVEACVLVVDTGAKGCNRLAQRAGFDFSRKKKELSFVFRVGGDMEKKKRRFFFFLLRCSHLSLPLSLSLAPHFQKSTTLPSSAAKSDDNNGCGASPAAAHQKKKTEEVMEKPPPRPSCSDGVLAAAATVAPAPAPPPPQKQQTTTAPPPPPRQPVPQWILGLISTTFFGPCPKHGPGGTAAASGGGGKGGGGGSAETSASASTATPTSTKKADLTHWCCACLRPLCASCIQEREHPAGHRLQQVSKKKS